MKFAAEVLFLDPAGVVPAQAALKAVGCSYLVDDQATADWPTVFGFVVGDTELDEGAIAGWLQCIVGPHTGDVVEWKLGADPWPIRD
jgi:hypothetical protein